MRTEPTEPKEKGPPHSEHDEATPGPRKEGEQQPPVLPSPRVVSAAKPTTEALQELDMLMTTGVGSLRDRLAKGKAERQQERLEPKEGQGEEWMAPELKMRLKGGTAVRSWEDHMKAREASLQARKEREEQRKREAIAAKAEAGGEASDSDSAQECDDDFDPRWSDF